MGFIRKAIVIGTGGLAPIKGRSYAERTAKATEKQLRLQKQQQAAAVPKVNVTCPKCSAALVSPVGNNIKCPKCGFRMRVWAIAPASTPPQTPSTDTAGELQRLAGLHSSGALTDAEFAAAKAKVLGT